LARLFRGCRPLRGSCPRPVTLPSRVSDRPSPLQRVDRIPPQSVSVIPSSRTRIAACRAPLMRSACPSKTSPASWRLIGLALPPCGSGRSVVCRRRAPSV
jgi:hypothetical protein